MAEQSERKRPAKKLNPELQAMSRMHRILSELPDLAARHRVVNWLEGVVCDEWEKDMSKQDTLFSVYPAGGPDKAA